MDLRRPPPNVSKLVSYKGDVLVIELMPLLGERTVMLIVARISGTPEEVDRGMARSLGVYVEENLRLQHALEEAKAEMDAAAKTAREQASCGSSKCHPGEKLDC